MIRTKPKVFVIDDNADLLHSTSLQLNLSGYETFSFVDCNEALASLQGAAPDLVITDVIMPTRSGIEVLDAIHCYSPQTPVILMTGCTDVRYLAPAVRLGAVDYLVKPFTGEALIDSVKSGIARGALLRQMQLPVPANDCTKVNSVSRASESGSVEEVTREVISALMVAAEMRDDDTGTHIFRIGKFAARIADEMDVSEEFTEMIGLASQMHDVGKLGIPDDILLKPDRLTGEEFEKIKQHTIYGARILKSSRNPILKMAATIALSHHEAYDGSGYPYGLRGEAIPLEGRIVMLVDCYDALRSERVYKQALSHEKVVRILTEGDATTGPERFDPRVLEAFKRCADEIDTIFESNTEAPGSREVA